MLIEDLKELLLVISIIDTAAPTSLRVSCLLYQHVSRWLLFTHPSRAAFFFWKSEWGVTGVGDVRDPGGAGVVIAEGVRGYTLGLFFRQSAW